MARKYAKRKISTKSKTYTDYLMERAKLEDQGYILHDAMTKKEFESYYERLKAAKREGEIKSSPWQELKRRERFITRKQAKIFQQAEYEKTGHKITLKQAQMLDKDRIRELGKLINDTKSSGLYGGDYE